MTLYRQMSPEERKWKNHKRTEEERYWDDWAKEQNKLFRKDNGIIGEAHYNLWSGGKEDNPTSWQVFKEIVSMFVRPLTYPFRVRYCWIFGHRMDIDHSSITPDSGTESLECSRCGYRFSHTYY